MGLWGRIFGGKTKATEGAYREGPYLVDGGWLPKGAPLNFWQMGMNPAGFGTRSAMVEACVSAYSQTLAMCPGDHWRRRSDGGRDRVTNSPLAKIIRRPNAYQTISDFLMNATRELYEDGNFYALAVRDERFDIAELHLMQSRLCNAQVAQDGSVFYHLGGNPIVDARFGAGLVVPARDVLHVRLHTRRNMLRGESPITAAALDVSAANIALEQQLTFLMNKASASIMLGTDSVLTVTQAKDLRAAWDAQTKGENAGGTPILTGGLKPLAVSVNARDSQLAEMMAMSEKNIALAFRVPLQILGIGGTAYASTELLMQSWIATGLGFALNHIEEAMGQLFQLGGYPDEYVEFNTKALLRSSFKDRIEGLAKSTISGIHSPDEARNEEDLPTVPGGAGKEPRVQQQVVPLSFGMNPPEPPKPPTEQPAPVASEDETDKAIAAMRMKFSEAAYVH